MKRLIAILLCLSQPSWAALSVLNRVANEADASGGAIATAAQAHTSGNLLVCLVQLQTNTGATTMTITNTAGDTWSHATAADKASGNNKLQIFYTNTSGNGSDIVTATPDANCAFRALVVYEITDSNGSFTGDHLDGTGSGTNTNTTITTDASVGVTAAEDIILAFMLYTSASVSAGTGYTLSTVNLGSFWASEYHIVTAAEAATATGSASATWAISAASFKGVTASGGTLAPQRLLQGVGM